MSKEQIYKPTWHCVNENGRLELITFKSRQEADKYASLCNQVLKAKLTPVLLVDTEAINKVVDLIKNDAYAMSFQSMRQYRNALIESISHEVGEIGCAETEKLKSRIAKLELILMANADFVKEYSDMLKKFAPKNALFDRIFKDLDWLCEQLRTKTKGGEA